MPQVYFLVPKRLVELYHSILTKCTCDPKNDKIEFRFFLLFGTKIWNRLIPGSYISVMHILKPKIPFENLQKFQFFAYCFFRLNFKRNPLSYYVISEPVLDQFKTNTLRAWSSIIWNHITWQGVPFEIQPRESVCQNWCEIWLFFEEFQTELFS